MKNGTDRKASRSRVRMFTSNDIKLHPNRICLNAINVLSVDTFKTKILVRQNDGMA